MTISCTLLPAMYCGNRWDHQNSVTNLQIPVFVHCAVSNGWFWTQPLAITSCKTSPSSSPSLAPDLGIIPKVPDMTVQITAVCLNLLPCSLLKGSSSSKMNQNLNILILAQIKKPSAQIDECDDRNKPNMFLWL